MDNSGAPDLGITARLIYSYFLSNTAILIAAESSFVGIAGMIPQDVSCHSTLKIKLWSRKSLIDKITRLMVVSGIIV
jgi:hypothetical protein